MDKTALHIGAMAFIHRFGSSLNEHVHFHVCVVDGVWAVLIARIYEVFPLLCAMCGGQMRLIAFIIGGAQIRRVLEHIRVESEPPRMAPARGPSLWRDCDAQVGDGVQFEPDWDLAVQPELDYEAGQRVNW